MDLRSGRLYWGAGCRQPRLTTTPPRRLRVDALILGAGVTGAFAAHQLTQAGATVAVLDCRGICKGSTPASTALLLYEIDTPLLTLSKKLGETHARAAYTASHRVLHDLRTVVEQLEGDVELEPRESLQLAVGPADAAELRHESAARRDIGIEVEFLSRRALQQRFGFDRPGAQLSRSAFEANPVKLTCALLGAARQRGAHILPSCKVDLKALAVKARPFKIVLPSGTHITAEHVIIATGYETPEQFPAVAKLTELRSTYVIATAPIRREPWPGRALLWETGDPYFYARTTADGRIIAGGFDEPFKSAKARDAMIVTKSRELTSKLRELLPTLRTRTAYRWAGTFAQTEDGLPYIGEDDRWRHVHFALGYGGNGITFSLLAAQIITAEVKGTKHPAASLFRFDR